MKKKSLYNFYKWISKVVLLCLAVCFLSAFSSVFLDNQTKSVKAEDEFFYSKPSLKCYSYDVNMKINKDRKIEIKERIDVEFLKSGFSMFYKSLPKDMKYSNIEASATGSGDEEFTYYVEDNEYYSDFIDVCCVGNANKGARNVYEFSYIAEAAGDDVRNGMRLDVVGYGSPFELNNVTVTIEFPEKPTICSRYISGVFGEEEKEEVVVTGWSADGKTLVLQETNLPLVYNDEFEERTAEGITLEFMFEEGVLTPFVQTQIFTERTWIVLLVGLLAIGGSVLGHFLGKNRGEIIPVVNVKAPDEMDPMYMGYLLDGSIGDEDVTSMIYYFADKGYLTIDFSDEKDPVLNRVQNENGTYKELPLTAPIYQKTLFEGLFEKRNSVPVSALREKYYETADEAKLQLALKKPPRYDKKSVAFFLLSTLFSALACAISFVLAGIINVGGNYAPADGFIFAFLLVIACLLLWVTKELEFKKTRSVAICFLCIAYAVGVLIFSCLADAHVFTGFEKFYLAVLAICSQLIGYFTLSRTETYNKILGDILGFKDFIVVTEEDKIKVMLEENPELYYKVLPYAQVLGVTDEWTDRFKNIMIEKPSWAYGFEYSVFDHMLINRSMRLAAQTMYTRPQNSSSTVGRTGGGGFGGFSGGGRGGGGFGAR